MTRLEHAAVPVPGGTVALALHLPEGSGPFPYVLACHGLSASKESDKYLMLGEELPRRGLALARFDFRGCGESSGVESDTTVATRIEDADAVLDRLAKHPRLDTRVGLLGSSMGGVVALHVAAIRGDRPPVVTWNAPADFTRLARPDTPGGLGPAFFAEVETGRYASTPPGVARHLTVQSADDDVVPPDHGRILHTRAAEPKALLRIAGADHRLSDPDHRRLAMIASCDWFLRFFHLRGGPDMAPTPPDAR
ncbi:MAG: alpha/beta hydrolase [Candidatus Rokubacteria bacterium]|nr:alpha/beta hydrolase [Candidatus Rokubacteria bacterium]